MPKMKKTLLSLPVVCMLLCFSGLANAQKKKTLTLQSRVVEALPGTPNNKIKSEAPASDKVEAKSRGGCVIDFTNYSGLYVKIYVDGYYKSTLSPYGSCTVITTDGYTTVYLISTGGTKDWEAAGTCNRRWIYHLY